MENSKSKLAGESLGNDIYSAMKRITHFQYKTERNVPCKSFAVERGHEVVDMAGKKTSLMCNFLSESNRNVLKKLPKSPWREGLIQLLMIFSREQP